MAEQAPGAGLRTGRPPLLYWWMRPAWLIGRARVSLGEATLGDAIRLRQLPPVIGTWILPALAILIPLVITALHATTLPNQQADPNPWTLVTLDIYTESIPIMAAALVIGLASPAAGALFTLLYGAGNLGVTVFLTPLELGDEPHRAIFGRLVTYGLLWLLAVETPMRGRSTVEWVIRTGATTSARRWPGIALGAVVVAVFTFAWVTAMPMLITILWWTVTIWSLGGPAWALVPLYESGPVLVAVAALAGVALLAIRYSASSMVLSPTLASTYRVRPAVRYVVQASVALALLSAIIEQPIDIAILVAGLFGAPIAARVVLRLTGLGRLLGRIPAPLRLMVGFAIAIVATQVYAGTVDVYGAQPTRFFPVVVAVTIAYAVIVFFAAADRSMPAQPPAVAIPAQLITVLALALLLPSVASADNCEGAVDCFTTAANLAFAAAAAALAAAIAALTPAPPRPETDDELPEWTRDLSPEQRDRIRMQRFNAMYVREHGAPYVENPAAEAPHALREGGGR